jgi:hypothetical protein
MKLGSRAVALSMALLLASGSAAAGISVVFSKDEISIIHDYYSQAERDDAKSSKHKQKSKQKNGGLPPGIAKNLARGKALPPGIAKKQLPNDLVRRLPPVHDGYERVIVDGRVLLVEAATQIVHDVLMESLFD